MKLIRRFQRWLHKKRYHVHYIADWPYSDPPVVGGYCLKGCGYHWERPL